VVAAKIAPLFVLPWPRDDGAGADGGPSGLPTVSFRREPVIEAMPKWIQPFTYLKPDRALRLACEGRDGRGGAMTSCDVQLFALGVIASVLVGFSACKFRGQMS